MIQIGLRKTTTIFILVCESVKISFFYISHPPPFFFSSFFLLKKGHSPIGARVGKRKFTCLDRPRLWPMGNDKLSFLDLNSAIFQSFPTSPYIFFLSLLHIFNCPVLAATARCHDVKYVHRFRSHVRFLGFFMFHTSNIWYLSCLSLCFHPFGS